MGMATAHRVASTQAPYRLAKPLATNQCTTPPLGAPANRYTAPHSNLIAAFPRAASAHVTTPSRLGSEDSPTIAYAQGPRKLFRMSQASLGKLRHIRVALLPLALSLSRRCHPHHKARLGREPGAWLRARVARARLLAGSGGASRGRRRAQGGGARALRRGARRPLGAGEALRDARMAQGQPPHPHGGGSRRQGRDQPRDVCLCAEARHPQGGRDGASLHVEAVEALLAWPRLKRTAQQQPGARKRAPAGTPAR